MRTRNNGFWQFRFFKGNDLPDFVLAHYADRGIVTAHIQSLKSCRDVNPAPHERVLFAIWAAFFAPKRRRHAGIVRVLVKIVCWGSPALDLAFGNDKDEQHIALVVKIHDIDVFKQCESRKSAKLFWSGLDKCVVLETELLSRKAVFWDKRFVVEGMLERRKCCFILGRVYSSLFLHHRSGRLKFSFGVWVNSNVRLIQPVNVAVVEPKHGIESCVLHGTHGKPECDVNAVVRALYIASSASCRSCFPVLRFFESFIHLLVEVGLFEVSLDAV
mmetsp:Transcript_36031/g.70815  ORF Transcript_36031/g.70815 Transcript_36031/m.70815 type:complete len:273 (-) Transcript_36031:659-1477(-)